MIQTVELQLPSEPSFALAQASRALATVGTLTEQNNASLSGQVTHGLHKIPVKVLSAPAGEGTKLVLQATGGDAYGIAVRSALARLETAIRNVDVPGFQADRQGMHPATAWTLVFLAALFLLWYSLQFHPYLWRAIFRVFSGTS